MTQPDWRIQEALKLIRQGRKCEIVDPETGDKGCGAYVYSQEGWDRHMYWHQLLLNKISEIDAHFNNIESYVVDPETGLEKRIIDEFAEVRGEAGTAINQVRTDATNAINLLRSDATAAIVALQQRVTALESINI